MKNVVFVMLAALFLGMVPARADQEELVIYSGRDEKLIRPVLEAFKAKSGIGYKLVLGESSDLLTKLTVEEAETPADCYLATDAALLEWASRYGLLRPLPSEVVAANVPAMFRARDNRWVGLSLRTRVIVYNTERVKPSEIRSVFDLAHPRWKGRVAITASGNDSFRGGIAVYLHERGREAVDQFLKDLRENAGSQVYDKHSQVVGAVAKGKADLGLVNHYYFHRHMAASPKDPIAVIYPDQEGDGMGVAVNISGVGIVRHTSKLGAAKKLVEFMASSEGQRIFAEQNMEYPVSPDVPTHQAVRKFETFKVSRAHLKELEKLRTLAIDLIQQAGLK